MNGYLGDGLYFEDDGFQIHLHCNGGMHSVYLETSVLMAFIACLEKSRGLKITVEKLPSEASSEEDQER